MHKPTRIYHDCSARIRACFFSPRPHRSWSQRFWCNNSRWATIVGMTFADHLFKRRHFDRLIITLCVRWYVRYKLSYRDLVEMMAERGLSVAHTTIMRWVQRFIPEVEKRWRKYAKP